MHRDMCVPGARLISLGEFARQYDELDSKQPVAVICASGSRSQSAALLGQKGFDTVYNVVGGTFNWIQHGLPLERNEEKNSLICFKERKCLKNEHL
jgi:rhodanese-related sulfurtransferase